MATAKLYYIGERGNPQLKKPYYKAYGQLSQRDAKRREKCAYGTMDLTGYNTEAEYNAQIEKLRTDGFSVN